MALVSYIGNGGNISQSSLKCRKSTNFMKLLKSWQFIISLKTFRGLINSFQQSHMIFKAQRIQKDNKIQVSKFLFCNPLTHCIQCSRSKFFSQKQVPVLLVLPQSYVKQFGYSPERVEFSPFGQQFPAVFLLFLQLFPAKNK